MQHRKVIPVTVLKENDNVFSAYDCEFVNETVSKGNFPSILNMHYSCFKKGFRGSKGNDFANGILPVVWKIF